MNVGEFMDFDRIFSKARMQTYKEVGGDDKQAQKLYQWNLEVSSALYESLMIVEVALRNTIDYSLRELNVGLHDKNGDTHGQDWLLDPNELVSNVISFSEISRIRNRFSLAGKIPSHDDILAQMTFGNWRFILPSKDDSKKELIWKLSLKNRFELSSGYCLDSFSRDVESLHIVRNRIAHGEPLLERNYTKNTMKSIFRVAEAIDPELSRYIKSVQRVTQVNKTRPKSESMTH
jgi:hypothetical protein